MLFDVRAALAEIQNDIRYAAKPANYAKPIGDAPPVSRVSQVSQCAEPQNRSSPGGQLFPPPAIQIQADDDPFPHGRAVNGNPKTWTGRIVSLDEWQRLSDWDRHGSTGKVWNALTRRWEP